MSAARRCHRRARRALREDKATLAASMSISTAFLAPPPDTEAAAQAMSQAGQSSTSNWSTKLEVADKVQLAISDFGNVARQLIKGSTSQEVRAL